MSRVILVARIRQFTVVAVLLSASMCMGQTLLGDEKEMEKILTNIERFSGYIMESDYEAIGMAYTEDAKIFPNNLEIISGRKAIVEYWTPKNGGTTKSHRLLPEEIKIMGDEAYDYGYYEGVSVSADGKESSWKGKYVVIWRKVDDDWKIYLDIWNRVE